MAVYYTRRELAEILHVSVKTIGRWDAQGMPHEVWGYRLRRYCLEDIRPWLQRRRAEHWRS